MVADFWASWCGPCKLIDPLMKKLESENEGKIKVVKIEVDGNPEIVDKYKVCSPASAQQLPFRGAVSRTCLPSVGQRALCGERWSWQGLAARGMQDQSPERHLMQVYGLPSLVLFRDGDIVEGSKHEGAIAFAGIISWLESYGVSA